VTLQFVDADGNNTWDKDGDDTSLNVIAPTGVTISQRKDFKKNEGTASFTAVADEYGTYSVRVVSGNGLSKNFNITFGEPAKLLGEVKMFIGSRAYVQDGEASVMDVAPFIENNRTFVPVRFIAEAFGAEVDWTPKTGLVENVFITKGDMVVTITIGSNVIEVLKDGEVEEVVADVAAFIRDGRTWLPLRAIGEIFGAAFDWGPKDAATQWVSFSMN